MLQVAVTADEEAAIRALAGADGESVSNWCYEPIIAKLKKRTAKKKRDE